MAAKRARQANPLPSWHPEDRPSYTDLIAKVCDCRPALANKIADAFPRGFGIASARPADFRSLGLSDKQAKRLTSAFELGRFVMDAIYERHGGSIRSPDDVRSYLFAHMAHLGQESFVVIMFDARQRVIDTIEIALGTMTGVDTTPREIFRRAIQLGAHGVFLVHNHPSGDPQPSQADYEMTHRMAEAGQLIGIPVVDSLVVGRLDGDPAVTSMQSAGTFPQL